MSAEQTGTRLSWEQAVAAGRWGETQLAKLAEQFGTPCYVYAAELITVSCAHYRQLAGSINASLHYAMKANGNLAVLGLIKDSGIGFDAASELELERCQAAGVLGENIIVTGPGKSRALLELALARGVQEIIVDSSQELERIAELSRSRPGTVTVGVRVNPDIDAATHPHIATGHRASKFGVDVPQALDMCREIAQIPGLQLGSLGAHIGSQISSSTPYTETAQLLLALQAKLADNGITPTRLDLGGGFGIGDSKQRPAVDVFAELVCWLSENCPQQKVAFQPGRALVGRAGILLTRVEYHKGRHLIVDAGMTELIRPALYGAQHGVAKLGLAPAGPGQQDVVGPVCESTDLLARGIELDAQAGDLLALFDAGAYGSVMASNYNGRLSCPEVMLDGDRRYLVRSRETVTAALADEIALR